jgi:hypothetical protein
LALLGKAALKDGKIGVDDLSLLPALLAKQQVVMDAFMGLAEVSAELKDLGLDEAKSLFVQLADSAKEVKAA